MGSRQGPGAKSNSAGIQSKRQEARRRGKGGMRWGNGNKRRKHVYLFFFRPPLGLLAFSFRFFARISFRSRESTILYFPRVLERAISKKWSVSKNEGVRGERRCRDTYLWFLSVAGAGEGDRYVSKRLAGIEERTRRRGGATHSLNSPVGTSGDNDRHRPPLVLCETLPHDLLDLTGLLSLGDVVIAVAEGERGEGKTSSAQLESRLQRRANVL